MKNILFVCLGNICRSPAAEGVMENLIRQEGLSDQIYCDSAGTSGWHIGEKADHRMRQAAQTRGYDLNSVSRQFDAARDFEKYDYVIAMDDENLRDLKALDPQNRYRHKLYKMTDFCRTCRDSYVPDPYYGGAAGFERVLNILEDACAGLLEKIKHDA